MNNINLPLASTTWDAEEEAAVQAVISSGQHTMGRCVREYEIEFARKFGSRFAVMTSSGSTANLLGLAAALYHPDLDFRKGAEIIVPAVSWSTTYFPVSQLGFKLVFVDVDPETFNISIEGVENAISERTCAVLAVSLLGNPADLSRLKRICDTNKISLLEDNCESMGAKIGSQYTGTFGLFGTFSTYFSHHICTIEGGVVVTDDRKLYDNMLSMRAHGWTRDVPDDTHLHIEPDNFLRKFRFVLPGYNFRPIEIEAAVGMRQLNKLDSIVDRRIDNAKIFVELFGEIQGVRIQKELGLSSWFGFAIVLEGKLKGTRSDLVRLLSSKGVECRPIVAGNFLKNPVIDCLEHSVVGSLDVADSIDEHGLFFGNHHICISNQLEALSKVIFDFSKEKCDSK